MKYLVKIIISSFAVLITSWLLNGVHVTNYITAFLVAFVLSLLNIFIKPILVMLTIPVTMFTLGLFLLVINAIIVLIATQIVHGFEVNSFWDALVFSVIQTIVAYLLQLPERYYNRKQSKNRI